MNAVDFDLRLLDEADAKLIENGTVQLHVVEKCLQTMKIILNGLKEDAETWTGILFLVMLIGCSAKWRE